MGMTLRCVADGEKTCTVSCQQVRQGGPSCRAFDDEAPGRPDPALIVGDWDGTQSLDEDRMRALIKAAADKMVELERRAEAYAVARERLRKLHKRMADDRERWANNTTDPCAVARAVAYQSDMSAVNRIIHTIETIAGDRP